LQGIGALAESCARQLAAWIQSIDSSPVQWKRHLTAQVRESRRTAQAAHDFRLSFLRNLKPEHPLFNSSEARAARGEAAD